MYINYLFILVISKNLSAASLKSAIGKNITPKRNGNLSAYNYFMRTRTHIHTHFKNFLFILVIFQNKVATNQNSTAKTRGK